MDPADAPGMTCYRTLAKRLTPPLLRRRIERQAGLWTKKMHQGTGVFRAGRWIPIDDLAAFGLRAAGLWTHAYQQFLDIETVVIDVPLERLPAAFDGFRLLHLSDLHCDLDLAFTDVLLKKLAEVEFDFAVLTGDFHNRIGETPTRSLAEMAKILQPLAGRCVGSLGNHDFVEQVAFLEAHGMPILLNENQFIEREGQRLYFCGIDDPHFFETHDLRAARAGVPDDACTILLSHSPETWKEAEKWGYDYLLAGHLHGGQLCLPGGIAVIKNAPVPRSMIAGPFRYGRLRGYTSRGTGSCGIPARLFCPPEMTIHVLRCVN